MADQAIEQDIQANDLELRSVRLHLDKGTMVKINGVPVKLDHDALVRVHPANVPLLFDAGASCTGGDA